MGGSYGAVTPREGLRDKPKEKKTVAERDMHSKCIKQQASEEHKLKFKP